MFAVIQFSAGMSILTTHKVTNTCMNSSNSSSDAKAPRTTLKLKGDARKSPTEGQAAPAPRPQNTAKLKPGAHWSDEYKERMQADMDALRTR